MINTNYRKRFKLLKSRLYRLVFRVSSKYAYAQIVDYKPTGDKILYSISTKIFGKYKKNKECCNKLGCIIGQYINKLDKDVVIDNGRRKFHTPRILYFVKGVNDTTNKVKINMEKIVDINPYIKDVE